MSETPPFVLPRTLIFVASIWLIGSWFLAIGLRPPVYPSSASYEPGVRIMLLCLSTGLLICWPLFRLSQRPTAYPLRQTIVDLLVLVSMVQVVLWPLRLVTTWTAARTAAIDAVLMAWLLLAGATVAAAVGSPRSGPRNLAMLACVAICLLGPALAATGLLGSALAFALIDLSPLMAVRSLGDGGGAPITRDQWRWLSVLFFADAATWGGLVLWTTLAGRRTAPA